METAGQNIEPGLQEIPFHVQDGTEGVIAIEIYHKPIFRKVIVFYERTIDHGGIDTTAREIKDPVGVSICKDADQFDPQLQNG